MQLNDILHPELVIFNAELNTKQQVLQQISQLLCAHNSCLNSEVIFNNLTSREDLSSTWLGHGIAIPHCRSDHIKEPLACLLSLKNTIEFSSTSEHNKQFVKLVFGLIVPEENHKKHLELLAKLAKILSDEQIRTALHEAKNAVELFELIKNADYKNITHLENPQIIQ